MDFPTMYEWVPSKTTGHTNTHEYISLPAHNTGCPDTPSKAYAAALHLRSEILVDIFMRNYWRKRLDKRKPRVRVKATGVRW